MLPARVALPLAKAKCQATPGLCDHHRFDIRELLDAVRSKLAAVPGVLDAAEGHTRVRLHRVIDEDDAGLDAPRERFGTVVILAPNTRSQAEGRIVGEARGVVLVTS